MGGGGGEGGGGGDFPALAARQGLRQGKLIQYQMIAHAGLQARKPTVFDCNAVRRSGAKAVTGLVDYAACIHEVDHEIVERIGRRGDINARQRCFAVGAQILDGQRHLAVPPHIASGGNIAIDAVGRWLSRRKKAAS
jgi:hypothetical protein